ncbi:MAG: glycosyltransferase family A protein [Pseudomonadota bacterium]
MDRVFYKNSDVALIVPTKDRPGKIKNLLVSLTEQNVDCLIIIVDGGKSVKDVVQLFEDRLNIEYFKSDIPGQIHQRNIGISKIKENIRLVGFIDDDIIFKKNALSEMLSFWNTVEETTAGISFNVITDSKESYSIFSKFQPKKKGKVLRTGHNTPIINIDETIRSQWLAGGCTIWRKDIIFKFKQSPLKTRWAVGEDVRFSYPIGKKFPLYVCVNAKVEEDDHAYLKSHPISFYKYQGKKTTLAIFYFVSNHSELSKKLFVCSTILKVTIKMIISLLRLSKQNIAYTSGQIEALYVIFKSFCGFSNILIELED